MEITPFVNDQALSSGSVVIRVNKDDQKRVAALVNRTSVIGEVTDADSFQLAKRAAGELKAMVNEVTDSKRAAKRPFEAVLASIENLGKEVLGPVTAEQTRILGLLNTYVQKLEAAAKEADRKRRDELERQEKAHQAKIREMEEAKKKAEEAARKAEDAVAKEKALNEAARRDLALAQAQLERAMEQEIAAMTQAPPKSLVPDGRVNHPWKFKLVNPEATVKAGCIRLLRVELNVLNCQDSCKAQLNIEPDKDPQLPGIEVYRDISVSVKASSRIE